AWVHGCTLTDHIHARLAVSEGKTALKKLESVRDSKRQLQALDEIEKAVKELKTKIQQKKGEKPMGQAEEEIKKNVEPGLTRIGVTGKGASAIDAAGSQRLGIGLSGADQKGLEVAAGGIGGAGRVTLAVIDTPGTSRLEIGLTPTGAIVIDAPGAERLEIGLIP